MDYVLRSSQTGAQSFSSFDEVVFCYSIGHFTGSEVVMQSVEKPIFESEIVLLFSFVLLRP